MVRMYGTGDRPEEDLTGRARIVDAAMAEFGKRGPSGATMRSVAEAAGVSVGLVQHYFKTKAGLLDACLERVSAITRQKVDNSGPSGGMGDANFLANLYDRASPIMPFIARLTMEDHEHTAALFTEVTASTAEFLTAQLPQRFPASSDATRDAAAIYTAMSLGILIFNSGISQAMGSDEPLTPSPRVAKAYFDAIDGMSEYFSSPAGSQMRAAFEAMYQQQHNQESDDDHS